MRVVCEGVTRMGNRCGRPAIEGGTLCPAHHPDPAVRSAYAAENGRKGAEARRAAKAEMTVEPRSLRTVDDLLSALETALSLVEGSVAAADKRAASIVRLVSAAHEIMRGEVEKNARRLAEILESHPELATRMAEVKALDEHREDS